MKNIYWDSTLTLMCNEHYPMLSQFWGNKIAGAISEEFLGTTNLPSSHSWDFQSEMLQSQLSSVGKNAHGKVCCNIMKKSLGLVVRKVPLVQLLSEQSSRLSSYGYSLSCIWDQHP